ncbi:MAG: LysM peptidoglycan-binding domain-containing protein [Deltaproteobacteria bacterium]|nr:LysM peptidoglycan-binding domain-containing protein [Deltaproteobacteria bacterium]
MMFLLLVSAVFCALATYTAVNLVTNRTEATQVNQATQRRQVVVDDMLITLNPDPKKAISIPGEIVISADTLSKAQDLQFSPTVGILATNAPEPMQTQVPPSPTPIPLKVKIITYIVKQGDNLYSISDTYNSSIELMALHGIDDDDLVPGQSLELPVANPDYCPDSRAYVVRDHDTVFSISQTFGTTPEAIRLRNELNSDFLIKAADVICVPLG